MSFYDEMAELTLELIAEFGQTVILRDETPGEFDPVTGGSTPSVIIDQPAQAILQDYGLQQSGTSYAAGTEIRQGDKKIMVAALTTIEGQSVQLTPPQLSTKVIAGGIVWTIVNIKEINPAGTPLLYEIQGRR